MIVRIGTVLLAFCVAACAGPQSKDDLANTVTPDGCDKESPGYEWKLKVVLDGLGAPVGVERYGGSRPIPDPANLTVKPCDTVSFKVLPQGRNRSAMVAFDKKTGFESPGKRPAYLTRRGRIVVPIDRREGSDRKEYEYSIHVDCDDNISDNRCKPLDPMIVVER